MQRINFELLPSRSSMLVTIVRITAAWLKIVGRIKYTAWRPKSVNCKTSIYGMKSNLTTEMASPEYVSVNVRSLDHIPVRIYHRGDGDVFMDEFWFQRFISMELAD